MVLNFWAMTLLTLSDASVLIFTSPIWTLLMASFFLGEKQTTMDYVATICCVVGIILVARPTFVFGASDDIDGGTESNRLFGVVVALTGSICAASQNVKRPYLSLQF